MESAYGTVTWLSQHDVAHRSTPLQPSKSLAAWCRPPHLRRVRRDGSAPSIWIRGSSRQGRHGWDRVLHSPFQEATTDLEVIGTESICGDLDDELRNQSSQCAVRLSPASRASGDVCSLCCQGLARIALAFSQGLGHRTCLSEEPDYTSLLRGCCQVSDGSSVLSTLPSLAQTEGLKALNRVK